MKVLRVALALLFVANLGSIFITDALPTDPALFGQKPFHSHTTFEIKGEPSDTSHWSSHWGANRPGKPQQASRTEVELVINHGVRGVQKFVYVEILADSQADADAVMSLLENDFSQAYPPTGQFQQSNGLQHLEKPYDKNRFFWRQRFELLLIANAVVIFCILIVSIFATRKTTNSEPGGVM